MREPRREPKRAREIDDGRKPKTTRTQKMTRGMRLAPLVTTPRPERKGAGEGHLLWLQHLHLAHLAIARSDLIVSYLAVLPSERYFVATTHKDAADASL